MCVDGWHRCQAGELLERSGYLKEIPCRLLAHLTDSEMTLVAYNENRIGDNRMANGFLDALE
eukprot:4146902-Prymnesium_polylepis.1